MKKLLSLSLALLAAAAMTVPTLAASHTVQRGDTMWKLAVQYQVGTSEIIDANPQIANPNLIYPGDVLTIPETDASVRACEQEVVRLVNAERAKHGLAASAIAMESADTINPAMSLTAVAERIQ